VLIYYHFEHYKWRKLLEDQSDGGVLECYQI